MVSDKGTQRNSSLLVWLKNVFLPEGYPHSVSDDYFEYQKWDTLQAFFNSIAGAVSLHATLGSLGVGQGHASPLSATLTWLTNSGAGMLTSVCFTYCKGSQLDALCKQWRLFADVANDGGHLLKLLTPLLPAPPLLTLTVASVLTATVGVAGGATRATLAAHQARANNLADVSAKDGSQENMVNLAALLFSLALLPYITVSLGVTWGVFLCLLGAHVYCNYRAVRAVCAPSLNRPRLLVLLGKFSEERRVPGVEEGNRLEPLLYGAAFSPHHLSEGWALHLGCSLLPCLSQGLQCKGQAFLISCSEGRVSVALSDSVTNEQILLACHIAFHVAKLGKLSADDVQRAEGKARESFPLLLGKMKQAGWHTEELFLNMGAWRYSRR